MTLTIKVGSSRQPESLKPISINRDSEPVYISSDHFEGFITVRIQHHYPSKTSKSASTCAYFDNHSRIFSLQWQGRFKATNPWSKDGLWNADEVLFVAEVEDKIHVPTGTSIATAFARTIDPSFIADGIWDTKRPWVGSPLVSGMNVLRVWKAPLSLSDSTFPVSAAAAASAIPATTTRLESGVGDGSRNRSTESQGRGEEEGEDREKGVGPWVNYGAHRLEEGHVNLLVEAGARRQQSQVSDTATIASMDSKTTTTTSTDITMASQQLQRLTSYQRRRYFTKPEHRRAAVLAPDLVIAGDFFNNFTNFETRRVNMGVSIRMDRVMRDDQPLRFVCKSRLCLLSRRQQQQEGPRQEKGWRVTRRIGRNRRRRSKHEVESTAVFGGGDEDEEEMGIAIGDSDEEDGTDTIDDDGGEGDEHQEEMDDNREEIVFFVVELRWDQASMVL
ncbi:hypothetical protein BGZ96_010887 [Linnemannia gamsii]|uniref:Domain of unknown function at the cortex 1 domain-containing protein n=1 Tax=Linnemannia gamsii TaxID=64522 RepID=A0ABQ7JTD3_9FUNG|nr:hypothetical protein BGZ96_010887 [Linnemannia gamsii]